MTAMTEKTLRLAEAFKAAAAHTKEYARRNPRQMVFWSILVLFVLVVSLGEFIGVHRLQTRVMTGVALLVFYGLYQAVITYREEKRGRVSASSLNRRGVDQITRARPDRQGQMEAMQTEFEEAIVSLKQSPFGQKALSLLPWYVLIGPPASGKSTALMNSGLQALYPKDHSKGVGASGARRFCDWWLTNEAVFLDVGGRYSAGDECRDEWLAILDSLKQHRGGAGLNGVLVMVSLPDLLLAKDDKEIERHAEVIRARLAELIERLGVVFSVHLVFTKCDLLRGFVEFFENLNDAGREEQVWGCTFPASPGPGGTPQLRFQTAFDGLLQGLEARRHSRLLSVLGSKKLQEVFSFPLHLALAKENLNHFVDALFPPSQSQDGPLFRGFYLTSATQEGLPLDEVVNSVNRRAGLPAVIGATPGEPREKRPYFIKHLLTGIVIPDQTLARPSSAARRRMLLQRRMLVAGTAVAGVACLAAGIYSYALNRDLGKELEATAEKSYGAIVKDAPPFVDGVQDRSFERFREQVQALHADHEGTPTLVRRWGMNREGTLYDSARDLYVRLFHRLYRDHTRTHLEDSLRAFAADPALAPAGRDSDYYYSYLKTYLMLSSSSDAAEKSHLDRQFLTEWLQQVWHDVLPARYGAKSGTAEVMKAVDQQIGTYARLLPEGQVPFTRDVGLVKAARVALEGQSYSKRIYARVKREMMRQHKPEPVTLTSLLQGQKTSLLDSHDEIPGFFTPKFDNGLFVKTRDRVLDQAYADSWVLDVPQRPRADVEKEIHQLYRDEYIGQWSGFLKSIKVRPANTREEAITVLEGLTQENSVLVAVLKAVDEQTSFSKFSDFVCDVSKGWIRRSASPHPVADAFKSLHEFAVSCPEGQGPPLKQYMQELQQLRDVLTRTAQGAPASPEQIQTQHRLRALNGRLDPHVRPTVLDELVSLADKETGREISRDCAQGIGDLFPFRPGKSDEVTISNLKTFFHPQSGRLLKFYAAMEPMAGTLGSEPTSNAPQQGYRQAKAISEAFFPLGSDEPKVPFEMKPQATGGVGLTEIRLVIEGQELVYLNGAPEIYSPFQWTGRSDERGALLQISVGTDESRRKTYTKTYDGRWGLFRMLQDGNPVASNPTEFRLSWKFPIDGGEPIVVRFNLKAEQVKHPFAPRFFSSFRCPKSESDGSIAATR